MEIKYKKTTYGNVPIRLYKYMNFDGALKSLTRGCLKYTPQYELNDIFEYTFSDTLHIDLDKIVSLMCDSLCDVIAGKKSIPSDHFLYHNLLSLKNLPQRSLLQTIYPTVKKELGLLINKLVSGSKDLFDSQLSHNVVCCFSETNENAALWAHYADNNKGVVFGFEPCEETDSPLLVAKPVNYVKELVFPLSEEDFIDYLVHFKELNKMQVAQKPVFTKKIDWKYEREWRVAVWIRPNEKYVAKFYSFQPIELKEVLFGCYMPRWQKEILLEIIKTRYHYAECFDTYPSRRSFKYLLEKIKI